MLLISELLPRLPAFLVSLPQLAADEPTRVQCRGWDQAFLSITESSITLVFFCALLGGLAVGILWGRRAWWAAAPYLRVAIAGVLALLIALFAVLLWPSLGGLGRAWMSGVDPAYLACRGISFGAEGFFDGAIGAGVAAFSQMPTIALLLVGAAALGGLLCLAISYLFATYGPFRASRA